MHYTQRDMTLEEFDAWVKASDKIEAVAEAADEEGGPRLSLVRLAERGEPAPTDLLPPAAADSPGEAAQSAPDPNTLTPPIEPEPFDGIPLQDSRKRMAGWSAERQRLFLCHLAETGSVHLACASARISARSVYRLRARSPAFAQGFDVAQQIAVGRLSTLAFDRAIHGRTEQVWHEGNLVTEKRTPSDKLLMWLLARLDPRRFAAPWELRKDEGADPQAAARQAFPALLDGIEDQVS